MVLIVRKISYVIYQNDTQGLYSYPEDASGQMKG